MFEAAGTKQLRYLGEGKAVRYCARAERTPMVEIVKIFGVIGWSSTRPDQPRFDRGRTSLCSSATRRRVNHRSERPFDPGTSAVVVQCSRRSRNSRGDRTLQEKANADHHALLVRLHAWLGANGWSEVCEIPGGFDLRALSPDGRVVIFEGKTVGPKSELTRTRSALSQLLEYRFFHGRPGDGLCLVTNSPISDRRIRFLRRPTG